MVSTRPLLRKFAFVTLSAQAEGLLDCIRWLSAAIPPDRNHKCATDPGGVAEILASLQDARIPRLPTRGLRSAATPGYSLPTLRVGRSERTWRLSQAGPRARTNQPGETLRCPKPMVRPATAKSSAVPVIRGRRDLRPPRSSARHYCVTIR
jgi:hypothetical protein